jgi:hypothetical protein
MSLKKIFIFVCIVVLTFPSLSKSQIVKDDEILKREKETLSKYSGKSDKYSDYLVNESAYTTKGIEYDKKYRKLLLLLCADLIETHKFNLEKSAIGFYSDKKSFEQEKYYLGIEFNFAGTDKKSYETAASHYAVSNLKKIITSLSSGYKIFEDPNIAGSVLRFTWKRQGKTEFADFWITPRDIFLYQTNKLVLTELIIRATVTNMDGVVIRLPI